MTVNVDLERKGGTLRYCPGILLEGLKEPAKHLHEDKAVVETSQNEGP